LLALDVDGVLTDGRLWYGPDGEVMKSFDVKDGLGLRLLRMGGVYVAVISARLSPALMARMRDLAIDRAMLGREDKSTALGELLGELGLREDEVAYVGDDLVDIPVMSKVGLPIAVADAPLRVKQSAVWITTALGGQGAVREVSEALLEARGALDAVCDRFLQEIAERHER
jgi:3-deoxy-D-manno-octulosonate 8-phosphate phosphatase (KDO 8-P phosphatase)